MENELILSSKKGNKDALVKLIMNKKKEYYGLALCYTRNREDALDAMQEMMVILFKNIKKLKDNNAFYPWSKKILVNCCNKISKKKKNCSEFDESMEDYLCDDTISSNTKNDIMFYLSMLNKEQSEAIKLKYIVNFDYKTISVITDTPVGTVKSRVFNGLQKLKKLMGDEY